MSLKLKALYFSFSWVILPGKQRITGNELSVKNLMEKSLHLDSLALGENLKFFHYEKWLIKFGDDT